jgi:hypothetical protein
MRRDGGFDIDALQAHLTLRDGTPVLIRRLVAEDAALYPDFLSGVTPDDLRLRFFGTMREVSPRAPRQAHPLQSGLCHGLHCRRRAKPKDARRGAPAR